MMSTMSEYTVTVRKGKNYTAIIRKPILTEEEYEKRVKDIKSALVQFGRERMKNQKYMNGVV